VLESTGGYEYGLLSYLCALEIKVHRADTRKVKNFIRSYGKAAKTDRLDAMALALYACERQGMLKLFEPLETFQMELRLLAERRIDLVQILVQEKNRVQAPGNKFLKAHIQEIIDVLKEKLEVIEELIRERIAGNKIYKLKKQ
jgi:transposase